jgi:diaminohydroxyphosphoribosylaminopyrimidine deaminase/5-amino-6-(5-phosphoribosylamino)uracil reductase
VGALIRQQLVDELITYIAPRLMGDASRGSINLGVIEDMRDCPVLEFTDIRNVGEDLRITSKINYEI